MNFWISWRTVCMMLQDRPLHHVVTLDICSFLTILVWNNLTRIRFQFVSRKFFQNSHMRPSKCQLIFFSFSQSPSHKRQKVIYFSLILMQIRDALFEILIIFDLLCDSLELLLIWFIYNFKYSDVLCQTQQVTPSCHVHSSRSASHKNGFNFPVGNMFFRPKLMIKIIIWIATGSTK